MHLVGKGWHCDVLFRFLADQLSQDHIDFDLLVKTVVWAAQSLLGLLYESCHGNGMWLLPHEVNQLQVVGDVFFDASLPCQLKYSSFCVFKLFKTRPKFHEFEHIVLSTLRQKNLLMGATWLDETWLLEVLRIARKTHWLKIHESAITRYCAGWCLRFLLVCSCVWCSGLKVLLQSPCLSCNCWC